MNLDSMRNRDIKTAQISYNFKNNLTEDNKSRLESRYDTDLIDFKKMFEKNETMMDQMTEDIMSLKEIMSSQNKLGLFERLLLSAKVVKTILLRNMELNKDYMDHTLQIDDLEKQIHQLQLENEDIRDRLSIMENLTGTDSYFIASNYASVKENMLDELPKYQKEFLNLVRNKKDDYLDITVEQQKSNFEKPPLDVSKDPISMLALFKKVVLLELLNILFHQIYSYYIELNFEQI